MRRNYGPQLFFIIVVLAIVLYNLYPTIKWYSMSYQEREQLAENNPVAYNKLKSKVIKLGLDLQGGIHLVLEVEKDKIPPDARATAVDRAIRVIRNRIDQFGVSEPIIQKQGDSRIIVELPGINKLERAKDIIGQTALLEFKLVAPTEDIEATLKRIDSYLRNKIYKILGEKDSIVKQERDSTKDTISTNNILTEKIFGLEKQQGESLSVKTKVSKSVIDSLKAIFPDFDKPFTSLLNTYGGNLSNLVVVEENIPKVDKIIKSKDIKNIIPGNYEFLWGEDKKDPNTGKKYRFLYLVKRRAELTGSVIKSAKAGFSSSNFSGSEPIVSLTMNSEGARKFAKITGRNIKRRLAIVLDNKVIMAPVIQTKITDGRAQITGLKDIEEAKDIAIVLEAGALPAPVKIIEERGVGATLGEDSIQKAKITVIISMLLVAIFLIFYYSTGGVITVFSLFLNLILVLGTLAMFDFTLTLPGIAGIVLTIGMAVDANVLIFERIREELKIGKTLKSAIETGFSKAQITILDANITTIFTAIILYYLGTGPIRGFALTLIIGILATLFVSLVITKLIFDWLTDKVPKLVSVGRLAIFKNPNYSFMRIKRIPISISLTLIAIGILSMIIRGFNLGIDFKGGLLVQVRFAKNVSEEELRGIIKSLNVDKVEIKNLKSKQPNTSEYLIILGVNEKNEALLKKFYETFAKKYGKNGFDVLRQEMVGPKIGNELKKSAILSVLFALLVIILYLSYRFRFWYGVSAIVALAHDVLITVGIFSLLQAEMSLSVIAAILTIVGYSLNDTIVIFDRIRENIKLKRGKPFEEILDISINETLSRTIITSLTTLFTIVALFFFGPETIKGFSGALLIGVIVGTYSSIYIASPALAYFVNKYKSK